MQEKKLEKASIRQRLWMFIKSNANTLVSLKLSVVALLMFLVLGYPNILPDFLNLSQRWLGVITLSLYLVISFFLCLFTRWKWKRKISVWAQTNLLFIFSILYYLRLNSDSFNLVGVDFGPEVILIILGLFAFFVNRRLFRRSFLRESLLVGEVVLISLTSFSLVSLFELTQSTELDTAILEFVFNLPQLVWIGFASVSIALISALNNGTTKAKNVFLFGVGFSLIFFQMMMLLNFLNLSYWYKALLFLVFWDLTHTTSKSIVLDETSLNFYPKLIISTVYHILLFSVVFYFSNIINF